MGWPGIAQQKPSGSDGNLRKNVAGQIIQFYLSDSVAAMTGEAASIALYYSIDGGAVTTTVGGQSTPYEVDATNFPGWYEVRPTQAETNGDTLILRALHANVGAGSPYVREVVVILYPRVDHENDVMGSGFTEATDSLAALRGAMEESLVAVQRDD